MGKSKKKKGTKQTLEYVQSEFKWHVGNLKFRNQKQKQFLQTIESYDLTLCSGIAGSGKTTIALYEALKALEKNQIDSIRLVKSVMQLDHEQLGYIKGSVEEKLEPTMQSFYSIIDDLVGKDTRERLIKEEKIILVPIAFLRGCTYKNCRILIDEVQNIDLYTFKSIVTRIGEGSKMVFMGDVEQSDFKDKHKSSLPKLLELFKDSDFIGTCEFTDDECVRNPIIPKILDQLRTLENN